MRFRTAHGLQWSTGTVTPRSGIREGQLIVCYNAFMSKIISNRDAQRVPEDINNSPARYISHHGVYHPNKPDKIQVEFDCTAKFEGV